MSEWVRRRLELYQQRQADEKQSHSWQEKVTASYSAKFDALARQIASDVEQYNEAFPLRHPCRATINGDAGQIAISTPSKTVIISKAGGNVIQLKYVLGRKENHDYLEVASDPAGNVWYLHAERFLASYEDASELILDQILC